MSECIMIVTLKRSRTACQNPSVHQISRTYPNVLNRTDFSWGISSTLRCYLDALHLF